MKGNQRWLIILILISFFLGGGATVRAQVGGFFPQWEWGAGIKGSGLFSAPADDAFTAIYNPAHSIFSSRQIAIERFSAYEVPFWALAGSFSPNFSGHMVLMQSPEGLGFELNTYQFGLTLAASEEGLVLGVTPKLLFLHLVGAGEFDRNVFGFSVDLGANYRQDVDLWIFESFDISFSAQDLWSSLEGERAVGSRIRGGVSLFNSELRLGAGLTGYLEDVEVGLGFEFDVLDYFPLPGDLLEGIVIRAGVGNKKLFSFGAGIRMGGFGIDYSYDFREGSRENSLSTSIRF